MLNLYRLSFVIILLHIFGCSYEEEKNLVEINLAQSSLELSDVIEDVTYTQLETNDTSLIGWVDNIQYCGEKYFVLDGSSKRAVYVFESTGKFLYKIDKADSLGFEFEYPSAMQILPKQDAIFVLDPNRYAISKYDLGGAFVETLDVLEPPLSFMAMDTSHFLFDYGETTFSDYRLKLVDTNFNTVDSYLPKKFNRKPLGSSLSMDHNFISYIPAMSNRIYSLKDGEINLLVTLDFGIEWPNEVEIRKIVSQNYPIWFENFTKRYPWIVIHLETSEYLAIAFKFEEIKSVCFINKQTMKAIGSRRYVHSGLGNITDIKGTQGDYFLSILDPHYLKEHMQEFKGNDKLLELIESLEEEDNPIIMKYKLK